MGWGLGEALGAKCVAICYTALADQYSLLSFSFPSNKTVLTQDSSYSQAGVGIRQLEQEAPRMAAFSRWGPGRRSQWPAVSPRHPPRPPAAPWSWRTLLLF